jgi:hypothetical protein
MIDYRYACAAVIVGIVLISLLVMAWLAHIAPEMDD